jgi:GNAT superfamily N-acetyltransferase
MRCRSAAQERREAERLALYALDRAKEYDFSGTATRPALKLRRASGYFTLSSFKSAKARDTAPPRHRAAAARLPVGRPPDKPRAVRHAAVPRVSASLNIVGPRWFNGTTMKRPQAIKVSFWNPASVEALSELRAVLALSKRHSTTLGFLPNSAFTDRGRHKGLLIGMVDAEIAGYCLYDIHRAGHIKLVHVCVDDTARGTGLGKAMLDYAIDLNPHIIGVMADCRRDYELDRFWHSVGMTPRGERPGRALKGSVLVRWWRPLGGLDLFEDAALNSGLPLAVLDSNVVTDLYGLREKERPDRDSSVGLVSEWLDAAVTFAVSRQVDYEIHRIDDPRDREAHRAGSSNLLRLRTGRPDETTIEEELAEHIGRAELQRDRSLRDDIEHLADAIGAGADYFITNDATLIRVTDSWLSQRYGMAIVRPHQFVGIMQARLNQPTYESRLLESVALTWVAASDFAETELELAFINYGLERASQFRRSLRAAISAQPESTQVLVDEHEKAWALLSTKHSPGVVEVPMFRVVRGSRASTVALQLARHVRRLAARANSTAVRVSDSALEATTRDALQRDGFLAEAIDITATVINRVDQVSGVWQTKPGITLETHQDVAAAERRFWPLTLLGADLPTYIAPIHPRHAERLFGFSDGALFHSRRKELGLSREHVYFHAGRTPLAPGPGRLLWYVTRDRTSETRQLAAYSRLQESITTTPEEAHRRFAHLGVLSLRDIRAVANKKGQVHVVRFEDTELLDVPLGRPELRRILADHDVKAPILTFRKVPSAMFDEVLSAQPRAHPA